MLQGQKSFFSGRERKMERASGAEGKEQSVKIFLGLPASCVNGHGQALLQGFPRRLIWKFNGMEGCHLR